MGVENAKEVAITFETLFEILRREKSKEELQKLDDSFYADVLAYLEEKYRILRETEGKTDLFSIAERDETAVLLQSIRKVVRDIYDKREKKLVDIALNKAKTGSGIIDTSTLLPEEQEYFKAVQALLAKYREDILNSVLSLKRPLLLAQESQEKPLQQQPQSVTKCLKFLQPVSAFVGKELEEYGPFNAEDKAYLPSEIAEVLIAEGKATELTEQ